MSTSQSVVDETAAEAQEALSALEIAELQELVGKDLKALLENEGDPEDTNYAKVLERLNSTDAIAKGVESKLDSILENLDSLLESLGAAGDDTPALGPTSAEPKLQDDAASQGAKEKP